MALPYGSMDYVGFIEPIVQKNHLFVIPNGLSTKKDLGIVLDIDLTDGSNKKVEFDRINITSIQVTDEYIFAASNFNQTVYLDRYQRQNKTTDTVKLNDWMVLNVGVHNGQLLATGLEMSESNSSKVSLLRFNFEAGSYEELADLSPYSFESEPPTHILSYGHIVFMTSNDQFLIYNDQLNTIESKKLPDNMAQQMLIDGDRIFILHSDIVGSSRESSLTILKLQDYTMDNYPLGETIWQLTKSGNTLFGLDLNDRAVHVFDVNETGIAKKSTHILTLDEGLYLSAIFMN